MKATCPTRSRVVLAGSRTPRYSGTLSSLRSPFRDRAIDGHGVMISHPAALIGIDCGPRPLRQHRLVPGFPVVLESIEYVLVAIPKVRPFTRIPDHVEQEFLPGNPQVFPIDVARGALPACLEAPEQLARMRSRTAGR